MQKCFEIHTRPGLFRLVDDCYLRFYPKGGSPLEFTVEETHKLLNLLYDYRLDIISTNRERLRREEEQKVTNKAHSTLVRDFKERYSDV